MRETSNSIKHKLKFVTPETTQNVGTPGTGVKATEEGDGIWHKTTLLVASDVIDAFTVGDNAALGVGYELYTFPAGAIVVDSARMSVELVAADAATDDDTPDVGLGTKVASGIVSVLGGTAEFENLITGQTAVDLQADTILTKSQASQCVIESAEADRSVFLNLADTWADSTDQTVDLKADSVVTVFWRNVT
jgi:hypothetical protein